MKDFAALISALDSTTKTNQKLAAVVAYLDAASDSDKLWCVALLTGKRPRRPVKTSFMRQWSAELADLPLWLLEESYFVVGDLAETVTLILPEPTSANDRSLSERMKELGALRALEETEIKEYIIHAWMEMTRDERFVFNKLITGGFRIGVSQKLMVRALAKHLGEEENIVAHRLMGNWKASETNFHDLLVAADGNENLSRPYPFYLAYPIEGSPDNIGDASDWQIEYKWDGIRGQLIKREGEVYIWSRGEELVTDQFPELVDLGNVLAKDCVIDGEITAYKDDAPLPFTFLQKRLGRKKVGKAILNQSPVKLIAYDLLELEGKDLRETAMEERSALLQRIVAETNSDKMLLSEPLAISTWAEAAAKRAVSRENFAEGLMLKRKSSTYKVGRKRGDWWKWKVDPLSIDAVMIYAMRGHGRRANLYTDYTFAVWDGPDLVPFAKAYSGLTDKEINKIDHFVKKNTIERFGPVRSVKPILVFEIGFEGIAPSTRHKSGIALRFPRILRQREDKKPQEANTLKDLQAILELYSSVDSPSMR